MGPPKPAGAIALTEPHWSANGGGKLAFLEHYRKCMLEGLKKGCLRKRASTGHWLFHKDCMGMLLSF